MSSSFFSLYIPKTFQCIYREIKEIDTCASKKTSYQYDGCYWRRTDAEAGSDVHRYQHKACMFPSSFSLLSCVSDWRREADTQSRGMSSSKTYSQQNIWQVYLRGMRKSVKHTIYNIFLTPSLTQLGCVPTFLHSYSGDLPGYFAQVGGVVWKCVCEAFQGHLVAMRLQLHHLALAFELALHGWSWHIGVNDGFFGPGGPGELIGVEHVRLIVDAAFHSQGLIFFNTYSDGIAVRRDQQH